MPILTPLKSLFRTVFRKRELNDDLDAELRSYLDMLVDEKIAAGMSPEEALREARRELGGVERVKARVRERRLGAGVETVIQDVRFALRQFARAPGFAIVAILTLALGIGANTAVFSVVTGVLLRPLPYADEDRVATVWNSHPEGRLSLSENELVEYRGLDAFETLGAYTFGSLALSGEGEAERLPGAFADHEVLEALAPRLVAGRPYVAEEDVPGTDRVILFGESLWERRFGRDPALVGRVLTLNGIPRTVVGILPAGFRLPGGFTGPAPDFVSPLRLDRAAPDPRNIHYLNGVAKLREGVGFDEARVALGAAAGRVAERLGTLPEGFSALAVPVRDDVVGSVRTALLVLLGAVGLVLLIACVNVANLLLARSDTRVREMAVRVSLGAGQLRLVRQLCTETGVLALAGGLAGLAIGAFGARALVAISPPGLPRVDGVGLDPSMFVFCLLATGAVAILIGLLPALRMSREEPVDALRGSGKASVGRSGVRTRRALVTSQVALAAMLAVGAGLLVRSLAALGSVDPGFDEAGVLTFQLTLPTSRYAAHADRRLYFSRLEEEIGALPEVESVGGTTGLPLASRVGDWGVRIRGRGPDGLGERGPAPDWMVVTSGYFEAMRIPVVEGRTYDRRDVADGFQTVVVSETFARRHWPDGDAIGAQLRMSTDIDTLWRQVIGVVADVRQSSLTEPPRPAMYLPHSQFPSTTDGWAMNQLTLAVRARADDPEALATAVRSVVAGMDPTIPVAGLRTMREITDEATASPRFQGFLFGGFAGVACLLVVVGVYGVTAYLVSRRTREIGIRLALGASPGGVRALVLQEGLSVLVGGLALGLGAAWMLSRLMAGMLFGVTARDPVTFVAVPLLLAATVLLASALPARRAARVDPQEALRVD